MLLRARLCLFACKVVRRDPIISLLSRNQEMKSHAVRISVEESSASVEKCSSMWHIVHVNEEVKLALLNQKLIKKGFSTR